MTFSLRRVQKKHLGRRFSFTVDGPPAPDVWRVECHGKVYVSSLRLTGKETDDFFRQLANVAVIEHGL